MLDSFDEAGPTLAAAEPTLDLAESGPAVFGEVLEEAGPALSWGVEGEGKTGPLVPGAGSKTVARRGSPT